LEYLFGLGGEKQSIPTIFLGDLPVKQLVINFKGGLAQPI
jgi:hypothetical protein